MMYFARMAIVLGMILAGISCFLAASNQARTGVTSGFTGQGKISRDEKPGDFSFLFWIRIILGLIAFVTGIVSLFLFL